MVLTKDKETLLLKAIKAEKNLNYCNGGVIGGFSNFFLNYLKEITKSEESLKKYTEQFNKYINLNLKEKHDLLKEIELLLKGHNLNIKSENNVKVKIEKKIQATKEEKTFLDKSIISLSGVGAKKIKDFKILGIETIEELLFYFPRRYEDRTDPKKIRDLENGATETIVANVKSVEMVSPRPRLKILKVTLEDDTGTIKAIWFNQSFLKSKLVKGKKICVTGKVDMRFEKQLKVTDYEFVDEKETENLQKILPVYPLTEKISQKFIRNVVSNALNKFLPKIKETLPLELIKEYNLLSLKDAIREMHFPSNWYLQNRARYRLVFEEFLVLHLGIRITRKVTKAKKGISHVKREKLTTDFLKRLSFDLTGAQKKVIKDIKKDMESIYSMNRLVQGDVGSGKTVVAIWALLKAISGGYQGALMAPTEILAEQHYLGFLEILKPLGIEPVLLTGSISKKEKKEKLQNIINGKTKLVIGTHALIQSEVVFDNLGLVVIDEQHRFGVNQRLELQKKGVSPDLLVMTATPIPRSLALTLYGDMELSVIDELPPGRQKVKTYHVGEEKLPNVYKLINKEVSNGQQVYVVCPLVKESEKLDLENATRLKEELAEDIFPNLNVGLIHGKLSVKEKEEVMEKFRKGIIDILVATTVIEVGVNIPNATIMVINNAERFGLAQLHQLRGRVGRGIKQAYCILVADPKSKEGKARMKIMTESTDGFVLAEEDLRLRGPGDFFGTRQHGLPDLKVADIFKDHGLMETTKVLSEKILEEDSELDKHPMIYQSILKKFKKTATN